MNVGLVNGNQSCGSLELLPAPGSGGAPGVLERGEEKDEKSLSHRS